MNVPSLVEGFAYLNRLSYLLGKSFLCPCQVILIQTHINHFNFKLLLFNTPPE